MKITAATLQDWPEIRRIYCQGIRTGLATLTTEDSIPTTGEVWFAGKLSGLIFKASGASESRPILGWAALSALSERCVYAGVAEVSVYVASEAQGQGIGRQLLEHLITHSEQAGLWTLQAGIFPENQASIAVHRRAGFRLVGIREKLGKLHGEWRDVALLERRSSNIM